MLLVIAGQEPVHDQQVACMIECHVDDREKLLHPFSLFDDPR